MLAKILIVSLLFGLGIYLAFHKNSVLNTDTLTDDCLDYQGDKADCWKQTIDLALKTQGLDTAFAVLANFYETEKRFAESCHRYVHRLGGAAYDLFAERKDIKLTAKASYCGYGFYHGFMEKLLHSTGDLEQARGFCQKVKQELTNETFHAARACYHGFGHGVVEEDLRSGLDALTFIAPGLEVCEKIGETESQKDLCGSGIFNALAIAYSTNRVPSNPENPYQICSQLIEPYFKKPCFEEMNTFVMRAGEQNFLKAARFVEAILEDQYAEFAIESLSAYYAFFHRENPNFEAVVSECRKVQDRLKVSCVRGFVGGLLESGRPEQEHLRAFEFCRLEILDRHERETCFQRFLSSIPILYPPARVEKICESVEEPYKKYCPR